MNHGTKILKKVLADFKNMSIKEYNKLFKSAQNMEQVNVVFLEDVAADFASKAHVNQKYEDKPYTAHLEHVVEVLMRFGYKNDLSLICAAWLHDTLEDTKTTSEEIESIFGKEVCELVQCVTNKPGKNRKERNINTYPLLRSNPKAIILKLADRIANVESCLAQENKNLFEMYKKEYLFFRDSLKIECNEIWKHLDRILL